MSSVRLLGVVLTLHLLLKCFSSGYDMNEAQHKQLFSTASNPIDIADVKENKASSFKRVRGGTNPHRMTSEQLKGSGPLRRAGVGKAEEYDLYGFGDSFYDEFGSAAGQKPADNDIFESVAALFTEDMTTSNINYVMSMEVKENGNYQVPLVFQYECDPSNPDEDPDFDTNLEKALINYHAYVSDQLNQGLTGIGVSLLNSTKSTCQTNRRGRRGLLRSLRRRYVSYNFFAGCISFCPSQLLPFIQTPNRRRLQIEFLKDRVPFLAQFISILKEDVDIVVTDSTTNTEETNKIDCSDPDKCYNQEGLCCGQNDCTCKFTSDSLCRVKNCDLTGGDCCTTREFCSQEQACTCFSNKCEGDQCCEQNLSICSDFCRAETLFPTPAPTSFPSLSPVSNPPNTPSSMPTNAPVMSQTSVPSSAPVMSQTSMPSSAPSMSQTSMPSSAPSMSQTSMPTSAPSMTRSSMPTSAPVVSQTSMPTSMPTEQFQWNLKIDVVGEAGSLTGASVALTGDGIIAIYGRPGSDNFDNVGVFSVLPSNRRLIESLDIAPVDTSYFSSNPHQGERNLQDTEFQYGKSVAAPQNASINSYAIGGNYFVFSTLLNDTLRSSKCCNPPHANFADSIALSANGTILAISEMQNVTIYDVGAESYSLKSTFKDENNPTFGQRLAMSKDAEIIAISGFSFQQGIMLYNWNGTYYNFLQKINREGCEALQPGVPASISMSLSYNGSTFAIGDRFCQNNDDASFGAVHIYDRTTQGTYEKRGIWRPNDAPQFFGYSTALSADGGTLVVGADSVGFTVQVFDWDKRWIRRGSFLQGGQGVSVDISYDGLNVLIGSKEFAQGGTVDNGRVAYYRWEASSPTPPPTPSGQCNENTEDTVQLKLFTDSNPQHTTWRFIDCNGNILASGGNYTEPYELITDGGCIPKNVCHRFIIEDSFGDGLSGGYGGNYTLLMDNEVVGFGSNFTFSETVSVACECEDCEGTRVEVDIFTDDHPWEISWDIVEDDTGSIVESGGNFTMMWTLYSDDVCLPKDTCYKFTIYDSYGDGSGGYYNVSANDIVIGGGGANSYTNRDTVYINDCPVQCNENTETRVQLKLFTDSNPQHTTWRFIDGNGTILASGGNYTEPYGLITDDGCIPKNVCHRFIIEDSFGDGLSGGYGGNYTLLMDNEVVGFGSNFTFSETVSVDCEYEYCEGTRVDVDIFTDRGPGDISWDIVEDDTGSIVESGGNFTVMWTLYSDDVCLPKDTCYRFTIYDSDGDGSGGYYNVSANDIVIGGGGANSYTNRDTVYINNCLQNEKFVQLGSDIDGQSTDDSTGMSVSLSSDGLTVAIGAPYNDGNGADSGNVRVFTYESGEWSQKGDDINGESKHDASGRSVSLSSDGEVVAIGAMFNGGNGAHSGHVRVYRYSNSTWLQMGEDIEGESGFDQSGRSVSLSSDGMTVAIGATYGDSNVTNSGHVRVYMYTDEIWVQRGNDIDGDEEFGFFGQSVSLSSDGLVVAVGAPSFDITNVTNAGNVRVYAYSDSSWTQKGQALYGKVNEDEFGYSVSLSSNGMVVAVGARYHDDSGYNAGQVEVFEYTNSEWIQKGGNIDGEAYYHYSGTSVSLSSDGTVVAVGATGRRDNGYVKVYFFSEEGSWVQKGSGIDHESPFDETGTSVSLSSDGRIVAIGAPGKDGDNKTDSGAVRVYGLKFMTSQPSSAPSNTPSMTPTNTPSLSNYPTSSSAPSVLSWRSGKCVNTTASDVYRMQVNRYLPREQFLNSCLSECGKMIGNAGCEVISSFGTYFCNAYTGPVEVEKSNFLHDHSDQSFCYTSGQAVEECNGSNFEIIIRLDGYPQEVSWNLTMNTTFIGEAVRGSYQLSVTANQKIYHRFCLKEYGLYTWRIYDSANDGLCCPGGYYQIVLDGVIVGAKRDNYGNFIEHSFIANTTNHSQRALRY